MKHFTMNEDHLKLLRRAYVSWEDCEFGAPSIDCKRPYGNSAVLIDIAEILGMDGNKRHEDDEPHYTEADTQYMNAIHIETETALQIVLATGLFQVGTYEADEYSINWRKI